MRNTLDCRQFLICLPDREIGLLLNNILTRAGFAVTTTSNLAECEDALRLGGFCAVITVAAMRGPITALSDLSLIDIFRFCYGNDPFGSRQRPEYFDEEAFLKRARFLAESYATLEAAR